MQPLTTIGPVFDDAPKKRLNIWRVAAIVFFALSLFSLFVAVKNTYTAPTTVQCDIVEPFVNGYTKCVILELAGQ